MYQVGRTRRGCAVKYWVTGIDSKAFEVYWRDLCDEDHFDAYCIFEYLALRERRLGKGVDSKESEYDETAESHYFQLLREGASEHQMNQLNIRTVIDVINHGRCLVSSVFRHWE
jgi:hypothetical protein